MHANIDVFSLPIKKKVKRVVRTRVKQKCFHITNLPQKITLQSESWNFSKIIFFVNYYKFGLVLLD